MAQTTTRGAAQTTTRDSAPATRSRTRGVNPWGVLAIILTAVFMQLLDTTITMVGVPSIQNSLHGSFGEIQLVVAGYMLAFACVLVTGGRLGDTYGRKRGWQLLIPMFIAGLGGGFFIAPVTNVVLAGISSRDAGSASGALATAQQVGAALGIAVVGVIFFGLLGMNANTSSAAALPQLRYELTVAGVAGRPAAGHYRQVPGLLLRPGARDGPVRYPGQLRPDAPRHRCQPGAGIGQGRGRRRRGEPRGAGRPAGRFHPVDADLAVLANRFPARRLVLHNLAYGRARASAGRARRASGRRPAGRAERQ